MSRLDQQVDTVRTRFLMQRLIDALAWALLLVAAAVGLYLLVSRCFDVAILPGAVFYAVGAAIALLAALIVAVLKSPSREAAAAQIDERLGLKERFSTALLSRGSTDPFAVAAVKDAESTSNSVTLSRKFPLKWPGKGYLACGAVAAVVMVDAWVPQMDLLGREEHRKQIVQMEKKRQEAKDLVEKALAEVNSIPKVAGEEKAIATAKRELENLLSQPIKDPVETARNAQHAMQDAEAARQRIKENQRFATAQETAQQFKSLGSDKPGSELDETRKALAEAKFDKAAAKLQDAVNHFNNADAATQEKTAKDMAELTKRLQQMASDPTVQEAVRKNMEKLGADKEQASKMMDEMAKAAAGDKDAANRVKDMAENLARKSNGGILPAPKELEKLMNQVREAQGQMNNQQMAQQLSQAAQQMANAMQQQAKQNAGQQSGQQQAQNQKNGQQGQQNQQQGQGKQDVSDAQQQMQEALQQMEAMQQAANMADAGQGDNPGEGEGGKWGENPQQGQGGQGQGQGQGFAGWNQGGQAEGDRNYKSPAPYTIKKEVSKGTRDEKGKVQAGWFVKADSIKGESKEQFKQIIESASKDQTDDIEQERIPMQAQKVVRDYFDSMQKDVK